MAAGPPYAGNRVRQLDGNLAAARSFLGFASDLSILARLVRDRIRLLRVMSRPLLNGVG